MDTKQFAIKLLGHEISDFDTDPSGYVASLGWSKELQKKSKKLSDKLEILAVDHDNLTSIIDSILYTNPEATSIDIWESNSVSDFLCNCIAGKINDKLGIS